MPTATDSRRTEPCEENPYFESDEESTRDEGYAAGKQSRFPAACGTAAAFPTFDTSTSLEGESVPRSRPKQSRAQETAARPASGFPYVTGVRTATIIAQDGTPYLVCEPRRERPMWNCVLPLALLAAGSLYAYQNLDSFARSYQTSTYERPGGNPDHRNFDTPQDARVALRFATFGRTSSEEGWLMQMDLPGIARNEINIFSVGPVLTVRGTHTCPKRNGLKEPTCIERHVFEEVRFPDEADMETAQAKLEHGVLSVNVSPFVEYKPRGRVIQIMDAIGEKVQDLGEAVKQKIGLNSATFHSAEQMNFAHSDEEVWNLSSSQTEEHIRDTVRLYVNSLRRSLHVPIEMEEQFETLVRTRIDDLIMQFRKRALTVQQLRDSVRRAVEEVWEEVKQEAAQVIGDVRYKTAEAYDLKNRVKDAAKQEVHEARDEAAELSSSLGEMLESAGHKVKSAVQEKVVAAKEMAHEIADDVLYNAQYGGHRAEEAGLYAAHRVGEQLERAQDKVHEFAHRAGNLAGEAVEKTHDRAKQSAHYMKDRASEGAERAHDRAREQSNHVHHVAEEAAQKAEHRIRDAAHDSYTAGRQAAFDAKVKPKSVVELIKEKFGWGF